MKKLKFLTTLFTLSLLLGCTGHSPENVRFTFNKDGKFKIAQFTDIHWVHGAPTTERTIETIKAVLAKEKPDIAILTGDLVYKVPDREPWTELAAIFEETQTPFAVALGNHDGEAATQISRSEIFDILLRSPYFVGEKGPEEVHGVGNYVIPVYGRDKKAAALLYCFDSNASSPVPNVGGYDAIRHDQIGWYREQSNKYTAANRGKPLPALAFFHIPLPEYFQVLGTPNFVGNQKEAPEPAKYNTGLFHSFLDQRDVMGVFVGHEHNNDYIGMMEYIALAYGRVSGWQAYGNLERGARIIELHENEFVFDAWISTPTGTEQHFNFPTGISDRDEATMTYLPARQATPTQKGVFYKYYEGKFRNLKNLDRTKLVSEGVMKTVSIAEAPAEDYFAYEFRCLLRIPERGVYSFYTISDDDSQIYVDDQLIVDKYWSNISRLDGKVALEAGFHEVKILFYEDTWGQFLEVGYAGKNMRDRKLADETLYVPCTPEQPRLTFDPNGRFRIVQFTDIHWIYGAPNVAATVEIMKSVLEAEKPDLVVITGDIVIRTPDRTSWTALASVFEEAGIPFTVTLGNHDAEPGTEITRSEIFDILLRSPAFVGEKGPEDIHGVGNFVLPVYGRNNRKAVLLYCFDSNAHTNHRKIGGFDEPVYFDQVAWYGKQSKQLTADNNGQPLPALAFFHRPFPEINEIAGKDNTFGNNLEEPSNPTYNTGLFASFLDNRDVMGVIFGHDHGCDYIGVLHHVALAYGRVTGSEGWDDLESGARVIDLQEGEFAFDTWIRTPSGVCLPYSFKK